MHVFSVSLSKKSDSQNNPGDYKSVVIVTPKNSYDAVIADAKRANPGWDLSGISEMENVIVID